MNSQDANDASCSKFQVSIFSQKSANFKSAMADEQLDELWQNNERSMVSCPQGSQRWHASEALTFQRTALDNSW